MSSSITTSIPTLRCWDSPPVEKGQQVPVERSVLKSVLIEVAPDREDPINSTQSILEFRRNLRIQAFDSSHWVYQTREKKDARILEPTMRVSLIGDPLSKAVRRSRSASSIQYMVRDFELHGRLEDAVWVWKPLAPMRHIVSPRPLAPTHLLVVFDTSPLSGIYSRYTECPINALVFAAHCPNLRVNTEGRTFPHQPAQELARVLMLVPHLDEFVPLVAYMHTKNQAALFRAFVPEWLRDILHVALTAGVADGARTSGHARKLSIRLCTSPAPPPEPRKVALAAVMQEVRDAEAAVPEAPGIVDVIQQLAHLKANLEFIGLYPREVWYELEITLKILLGSISVVDTAS